MLLVRMLLFLRLLQVYHSVHLRANQGVTWVLVVVDCFYIAYQVYVINQSVAPFFVCSSYTTSVHHSVNQSVT